jgi:FAD/FMN-containing dehydrogenase
MRAILFSTLILWFASLCVITTNAQSIAVPAVPAELESCLIQAGGSIYGSTTILPDDPLYNETASTLIFNLQFSNRHPAAIVMVSDESQIKKTLSCARRSNWRAVVRNGGHSFEGTSAQNYTIVIDMTAMKNILFTADNSVALVEAGALLGDVYAAAIAKNKGLNAGTCPPVGISGLVLGGGYGYWSRANGLACDMVESFRMITWEGKTLTVTADGPYADLFSASCGGGGGNFGVVLSWNIRLFDLPPGAMVQYGSVRFDNSTATTVKVWDFYQRWAKVAPNELGMALNFGSNNAAARILMYYTGNQSLATVVQESGLLNITGAPPAASSYTKISYERAVLQGTGWGLTSVSNLTNADWTEFRYARTENSYHILQPMSPELIEKMLTLWQDWKNSSIKIHPYGGAIAAKSNTATAFPWRQAYGLVQVNAPFTYGDVEEEKKAYEWLAAMTKLMNDGLEGPTSAYVNYLNESIEDWETAYYGENYPTLQKTKSRYDPRNFFRAGQTIRPAKTLPCRYRPCLDV